MSLTVLDGFGFSRIVTEALNLTVVRTSLFLMLAGGWHGGRHFAYKMEQTRHSLLHYWTSPNLVYIFYLSIFFSSDCMYPVL